MNLRIHKKLCKRAAPLLPLLGDKRKQYKAQKWDCSFGHGGLCPCDFKHWERHYARNPFSDSYKVRPRHDKHWIVLHHPDSPLKGTVMVGSMSGYYEPEWSEETAWESLCRIVEDRFSDWPEEVMDEGGWPKLTRDLSNVSKVFAAARDIISESETIK